MLTDSDVFGAELEKTLVISPTVFLGMPEANLRWLHNGEILSSDTDNRVTVMPSGQLLVMDVRASDRGTYELTATNTVGTVRKSVNITISCEFGLCYWVCYKLISKASHSLYNYECKSHIKQ